MNLVSRAQFWNHLFNVSVSLRFCTNAALTFGVLLAAYVLYQPVFDWSWRQLTRDDRQYHVLVSLVFVLLCIHRLIKERQAVGFAVYNPLATAVVFVASTAYLLNQYYLQLNTISLALFLLFSYGLLGHFVSHQTWRSCLLALLLTILVLPFEGYLDIFLGFPMRLLGAEAAVDVLRLVGVSSVSTDTVLLIDNRAAIVDIDCSGIRGFWIGCVFFCAITWLERYRMDLRWLLIALVAALLLFFGNVARIVTLVLLDLVFNKAELAQQVHESLGLIAFASALFVSWLLLRAHGRKNKPESTTCLGHTVNGSHDNGCTCVLVSHGVSMTTLMLLVVIIGFSVIPVTQPALSGSSAASDIDFLLPPQRFKIESLNKREQQFFADNAADAKKYSSKVEFDGSYYDASVLIVLSHNWKAQHTPENCYIAQGYKIAANHTEHTGSGISAFSSRSLSLHKPSLKTDVFRAYTSDYWYQSEETTTANQSHRVLAQLRSPNQLWVMASVLWREGVPNGARQLLLQEIRKEIEKEINNHG